MKIRISHQSLRLRLSPKDLDLIASANLLRETLQTGPESFLDFQLLLQDQAPLHPLEQVEQTVYVRLSKAKWKIWATGPNIEWNWDLQNPTLHLSIEKDLKPARN